MTSNPPDCQSPSPRTSLLADVLTTLPELHTQLYFKSSLVALSHAMEDQVLSGQGQPLIFANFQKERYYRQEARRYHRISRIAQAVFVLATPETDFVRSSSPCHTVALDPTDPLTQEWHLIVIDDAYASCLVCRERLLRRRSEPEDWTLYGGDTARQFEGIWSFDRQIVLTAARHLLPKIHGYRPDLSPVLDPIRAQLDRPQSEVPYRSQDPAPFAERLITYLQAGQYKLQRTYRAIYQQERKERLANAISTAIRQTLEPADVLQIAVQELGQVAQVSRCLLYRCQPDQLQVSIGQEYCQPDQPSLRGQDWPLLGNPFLAEIMTAKEILSCGDTATDPRLQAQPQLWQPAQIRAWLGVPVVYQGRLLGILELHRQQAGDWPKLIIELAEAIALQVGVALIQAEAYRHLEDLNQQLAALDKAKSDLIAVTGHELRTPLSTIQVCLETLSGDPDMPPEIRQTMLDTALQDAGRLQRLVQDFLTLSKLESGRIRWHIEPVSGQECIELALSSITARRRYEDLPQIRVEAPDRIPMVRADGEWLVEVLRKLLDNACKFTPATGQIWLRLLTVRSCMLPQEGANRNGHGLPTEQVQFTIADSGRGISAHQLQIIFERFYQGEGSLRRSVTGTGLGLAISRLIVEAMGGQIWAESAGEEQGSAFHFTLPAAQGILTPQWDGQGEDLIG